MPNNYFEEKGFFTPQIKKKKKFIINNRNIQIKEGELKKSFFNLESLENFNYFE